MVSKHLCRPQTVFAAAFCLRAALLLWSKYQDAHSPVKYTDIDYYVFTDAARYVAQGRSPYERETYRYTPLLAWLLLPTAWGWGDGAAAWWFDFGKVLFAASDLLAGWLLMRVLREHYGASQDKAVAYAAVWLLNPMVAGISTRGSCEGLLGVLSVALVYLAMKRQALWAGVVLGLSVHFKIYPFIYGPTLLWYLGSKAEKKKESHWVKQLWSLVNRDRILLILGSLFTFTSLNLAMYLIYGQDYIQHSWTYHLTRLDHRHNFSIYNTLLHINSSPAFSGSYHIERLAFVPQILLSAVAIPLALAKKDLAGTMFCQTFAFVAFNKVCTSQYFLWYLIFLPIYLPRSRFMRQPVLGIAALAAWIAGQAYWLYEGYRLEFLGISTFVPGLWSASVIFFGIGCLILGSCITDISKIGQSGITEKKI